MNDRTAASKKGKVKTACFEQTCVDVNHLPSSVLGTNSLNARHKGLDAEGMLFTVIYAIIFMKTNYEDIF